MVFFKGTFRELMAVLRVLMNYKDYSKDKIYVIKVEGEKIIVKVRPRN